MPVGSSMRLASLERALTARSRLLASAWRRSSILISPAMQLDCCLREQKSIAGRGRAMRLHERTLNIKTRATLESAMPKRSRGEKRPSDVVGMSGEVMRIATGEEEEELDRVKSAAAELGSRGGKARAAKMSPKRRTEIARRRQRPGGAPSSCSFWGWIYVSSIKLRHCPFPGALARVIRGAGRAAALRLSRRAIGSPSQGGAFFKGVRPLT